MCVVGERRATGSAARCVDAAQIGALRIVWRGMIGAEKSRGSHAIALCKRRLAHPRVLDNATVSHGGSNPM